MCLTLHFKGLIILALCAAVVYLWFKLDKGRKICIGLQINKSKNPDVEKIIEILNGITVFFKNAYICKKENKKMILEMIDQIESFDGLCLSEYSEYYSAFEGMPEKDIDYLIDRLKELQKIYCKDGTADSTRLKKALKDFIRNVCN